MTCIDKPEIQPHPWVLASRLLTERPTSTEHEETCRLAAITIRDLYAAAKTSSREQALDVIDKVLEILTDVRELESFQQERVAALSVAAYCVKELRQRYEIDDDLSCELEKGIYSGPPIEPTPEYWEGKKQRLRERFGELKDSGVPSFEEITKLPEEKFRAMMTALNEKKD